MKILLWSSTYLPVLGGVQTVTSQLAKGLVDRGHEVLVWTNKYPMNLPAEETIDGVRVRRFMHWGWRRDPGNWSWKGVLFHLIGLPIFPFHRRMLIRKIREFGPDVINVHFPDPQWPYLKLISKVANAPILTSLHGHDILRFFDEDGKPTDIEFHWEDLMRSSDGLTACSKWMIDQARRLGPMPVPAQAIWNGVDLERFEQETDRPIEDKYLFAFGRLEHHKGFHILLWAFQLLHRKNDLKLVIAGSGKEESALLKRADELGVSDQVVFTGRLDQDQIVAYAQHAEVVVVPSLREPFGISLLESLASGRPVVATKVGGMVEIGKRFSLELVEPNGTALAEGIKTALNFGKAPTTRKNTLRNEFSVDRMVEGYIEKFESLPRID